MKTPQQIRPGVSPRFQATGESCHKNMALLLSLRLGKVLNDPALHRSFSKLACYPHRVSSLPICRVMVPTSSGTVNTHERRERPSYDVVKGPSVVVFKWRLDVQAQGTGEDISGPRLKVPSSSEVSLTYLQTIVDRWDIRKCCVMRQMIFSGNVIKESIQRDCELTAFLEPKNR